MSRSLMIVSKSILTSVIITILCSGYYLTYRKIVIYKRNSLETYKLNVSGNKECSISQEKIIYLDPMLSDNVFSSLNSESISNNILEQDLNEDVNVNNVCTTIKDNISSYDSNSVLNIKSKQNLNEDNNEYITQKITNDNVALSTSTNKLEKTSNEDNNEYINLSTYDDCNDSYLFLNVEEKATELLKYWNNKSSFRNNLPIDKSNTITSLSEEEYEDENNYMKLSTFLGEYIQNEFKKDSIENIFPQNNFINSESNILVSQDEFQETFFSLSDDDISANEKNIQLKETKISNYKRKTTLHTFVIEDNNKSMAYHSTNTIVDEEKNFLIRDSLNDIDNSKELGAIKMTSQNKENRKSKNILNTDSLIDCRKGNYKNIIKRFHKRNKTNDKLKNNIKEKDNLKLMSSENVIIKKPLINNEFYLKKQKTKRKITIETIKNKKSSKFYCQKTKKGLINKSKNDVIVRKKMEEHISYSKKNKTKDTKFRLKKLKQVDTLNLPDSKVNNLDSIKNQFKDKKKLQVENDLSPKISKDQIGNKFKIKQIEENHLLKLEKNYNQIIDRLMLEKSEFNENYIIKLEKLVLDNFNEVSNILYELKLLNKNKPVNDNNTYNNKIKRLMKLYDGYVIILNSIKITKLSIDEIKTENVI